MPFLLKFISKIPKIFFYSFQAALISPGDEIIIKLDSSIKLPVYKKNAFDEQELRCNGLDIQINDITYKKNFFDNADIIKLSLTIENISNKTFSIFDIALADDFNTKYYPNIFENEGLKELKIKPNTKDNYIISFSVDNIESIFWLVFLDNTSSEMIAKVSLNNAYKNISSRSIKKNQKILQKKKNFYIEENPFDSD